MKNNSKGFTLIELLAVIVILGVLMIVAIPAMTRYIENSKRDVFADTAKKYITTARYSLISEGYKNGTETVNVNDISYDSTSGKSNAIYIPTSLIKIENGTNKSPWSKGYDADWGCIKVTQGSDGKYEYAFKGTDKAGNGISGYVKESEINRSSVTKNGSVVERCGTTSTGDILVTSAE